MGKISIVGLALVTSELATTDLPERSQQPGPDLIFSKTFVWEEKCHSRILPTLLFSNWPFNHYNEAEDIGTKGRG